MGVSFEKDRNKFKATTRVNGKTKYIGRYDTRLKAVRAFNKYENTLLDKRAEVVWEDPLGYQDMDYSEPLFSQKPSLFERAKAKLEAWRKKHQDN